MAHDTIPARLLRQATVRPDAVAYAVREESGWRTTSFREYAQQVRRAARALLALGFQPGQSVAILGFNRPEWAILDHATMAVGGAPAGIYTTSSPSEVAYILRHSEAPLVLVENREQLAKVQERRSELPALKHVVLMSGAEAEAEPGVMTWDAFLRSGDEVPDSAVDGRVAALEPGGLATLIYTSGTTGPPKAVMLSHDNLAWTSLVAQQLTDATERDRVLSYLPLSHIAEQMFTLHAPATIGYAVYFARSMEKLADDLKEVSPTVFFGVPRVWEKLYAAVNGKLSQARGVKKHLVAWARGVGARVSELSFRGERPSGLLALQYRLAKKLVFSKLHPALGLGQARVLVSGAAPIRREVLEFFASLDLVISEVYGQSEDTGPTSFNRRGRVKLGTVGEPVPGVEVKIAEDGEILVRGRNVFLGYYKDPDATAETLRDGWLHSGDLGELEGGWLRITGRKKDILITQGGKNITPKNIEEALKGHELVQEAVVVGDGRKYLAALIALDPEASARFASEHGVQGPPHESAAVRAELERHVERVNQELARVETVKRFALLPTPFSIDGGELTPTLKVKRKVVNEKYAREIEALYAE